jgi:hypothetical protein
LGIEEKRVKRLNDIKILPPERLARIKQLAEYALYAITCDECIDIAPEVRKACELRGGLECLFIDGGEAEISAKDDILLLISALEKACLKED